MAETTRSWISKALALRLIYVIAALMLAFAVVLQISLFDADALQNVNWFAAGIILLLHFVTTRLRVTFKIGRQWATFSLSEIAMIIGLFYIPPLVYIGIMLIIFIPTYSTWRKVGAFKVIYNICSNLSEMSVFMFVFYQLDPFDITDPTSWLKIYATAIVGALYGVSTVAAAVFLVEPGTTVRQILLMGATLFGPAALNPTIAIPALLALHVSVWSAFVLAPLGAVLAYGYRHYVESMRRARTTEDLFRLTEKISRTRQEVNMADVMLTEARTLVGAQMATLWLPAQGRHAELSIMAQEGETGVTDDPVGSNDPIRQRVLETGQTVTITTLKSKLPVPDSEMRNALAARGNKDLMAVPLRSGEAVIGCIEMTDRMGELLTFDTDALRLTEVLAANVSILLENMRLVDRLRHDAYHDALTGLPNRRRFLQALDEAIRIQLRPSEVVAVMQFDVESMRDVNETLGHDAGDRLVREVARRLSAHAPGGALVARLDGDKFAVLVRTGGSEAAQAQAQMLQQALTAPLHFDTYTLDVGTAVGIVLYPDHGNDVTTLMQRADIATYYAQNHTRTMQTYRPTMESRSVQHLSLVSELRRAIDENALTLYYQPKISLVDFKLVGVEALVRWEHPEQGIISPDDFIPVAESTGLISALTRNVLADALAQLHTWETAGRSLSVAVNLSARSLTDTDLPDELDVFLRDNNVSPEKLTLEITESDMIGDAGRPVPILRRLHALGVRLAVDDFGTGYSSLSYLRRLPVHEVKIDKSFVLSMATDDADRGIVRAIVDLGHHLGLTVVAEGVESEPAISLLRKMNCDIAQGYFFSRPVPADRLETWLDTFVIDGHFTMNPEK